MFPETDDVIPGSQYLAAMSSSPPSKGVVDPTSMPEDIPKAPELGLTSAPLKSAAFFIGAYCKEFNGSSPQLRGSCGRVHVMPNRGLYALQEREPGTSTLSEGGTSGYAVCHKSVSNSLT